jgi:SAM-dependent methyltransferase
MHLPTPVKSAFRRTPLYPVYSRWAPRARAFRDRSKGRLRDWARALRGQPPLPPPRLIELVTGSTDGEWFERSGRMGAESIAAILEKNGLAMDGMRAVLDFGCGVGRVLRYWSGVKGPRFHGSDCNPDLIQWCRQNLRFARFNLNPLHGALPYDSDTFDFIYTLSVFTHLTPEQQDFWMAELGRILRPGGHLLVTTHGEHYVEELPPAEQAAFRSGERVVFAGESAGTNVCATFHPPGYVRDHLAAAYAVIDFIPEGAKGNPWQDYWLLRKPPTGSAGDGPA